MIKQGDKVKVSKPRNRRQYYNSEVGYGEVWVEGMDVWHNKMVTVAQVDLHSGVFLIKEDEEAGWGFPLMCIKKVV